MDGLLAHTAFATMVAASPAFEHFTVVDVGCSAGIDAAWRGFGERLRAHAFDPDLAEIARLARAETLPDVHYVGAFVGIPDDVPYIKARAGRGPWSRNPMERLSVTRSLARPRDGEAEKAHTDSRAEARQADPARPLILRDYLLAAGVDDVDVLKIDIDGMDLGVLQSVGPQLAEWRVLAVGLEVNFFGSDDDSDHTFHAMDRFMRAKGFDLFDLSVRRYSHAALPAASIGALPGHTVFGRPLQGDALYLRDPCAEAPAIGLAPAKLLKLAAIATLAGLPDLAAAILLRFRDDLAGLGFDVGHGLDLLAAQAQPHAAVPLGYADYIAAFERDDGMFRDGWRQALREGPATAALRARLAAMEASTSWRLTAPLRWLVGRLRGGQVPRPVSTSSAADAIPARRSARRFRTTPANSAPEPKQ